MPPHRILSCTFLSAWLVALLTGCGSSAPAHQAPDDDLSDGGGTISVTTYGACGKGTPHPPRDAGQEGLENWLQGMQVPVKPGDLTPICVAPIDPVVFFAAHPDDETIGMAGAIRQAIDAKRPVFVELMTHGEASFVRQELDNGGTDAWHSGKHEYALSADDFGDARVREFLDAMQRLGVTGVHVAGFTNLALTQAQVTTRIDYWTHLEPHGLSLGGTAGKQDPQHRGGTKPHPDHLAVWEALVASKVPDVTGYCIYEPITEECAYDAKVDVRPWCKAKQDALSAYEVWDPTAGRYGIAYHSTFDLVRRARADCEEWTVHP